MDYSISDSENEATETDETQYMSRVTSVHDLSRSTGSGILKCNDFKCQNAKAEMCVGRWKDTGDWCYMCKGCGSTYFVTLYAMDKAERTDFGIYLKTARYTRPNAGHFVPCLSASQGDESSSSFSNLACTVENGVENGQLKLHHVGDVRVDSVRLGSPMVFKSDENLSWDIMHKNKALLHYQLNCSNGVASICK